MMPGADSTWSRADWASRGLLGLLRSADPSFAPAGADSFRAVNDTGFMVGLITPAGRNPATRGIRRTLGDAVSDDLAAVEITGLGWLENAPAVTVTAIDEGGYPLMLVAPDPRVFACHKAWLAKRPDRHPAKRRRDGAQARAVAHTVALHLPALAFDGPDLSALPADLRALGAALARSAPQDVGEWS